MVEVLDHLLLVAQDLLFAGLQGLDAAAGLVEGRHLLEQLATRLLRLGQVRLQAHDRRRLLARLQLALGRVDGLVRLADPCFEGIDARVRHLGPQQRPDLAPHVVRQFGQGQSVLRGPEDLGPSPVPRVGDAAAGRRGGQHLAHLAVGVVVLGPAYKLPVLQPAQLGHRRAQKPLDQAQPLPLVLELDRHGGTQRASPRAQGLDRLAGHRVIIQQSPHQRQHQRRLAGPIRAVNHVQAVAQRPELDRVGKAPPVLHAQRPQDHPATSLSIAYSSSRARVATAGVA